MVNAKKEVYRKLFELDEQYPYILPALSLDVFFKDNTDEWSIAPNQWQYGRPPIAELYKRLQDITQKPDVLSMWVLMHQDWACEAETVDAVGLDTCWPAAEAIILYTTASEETITEWAEGLECEIVADYGEAIHSYCDLDKHGVKIEDGYWHPACPPCPKTHQIYALVWD